MPRCSAFHSLTHAELVARAVRWLRNTCGCRVVLSEHVAYTVSRETPDAIGWVNNRSILIEVKTSRGDYAADLLKPARQKFHPALGSWRFYFAPPGVLDHIDLPEGWGLYAVYPQTVRHVKGWKYRNAASPPFSNPCRSSEVALLTSALAKANEQPKKFREAFVTNTGLSPREV